MNKQDKKLVIRYHYNEDPNAPELQEILEEAFYINEKEIFTRHGKEIRITNKNLEEITGKKFEQNDAAVKNLSDNTTKTDLFLSFGFRTTYSSEITEIFEKWFREDFIVMPNANNLIALPHQKNIDENHTGFDMSKIRIITR